MKTNKLALLLLIFSIGIIIFNIINVIVKYPEKYASFDYWSRHSTIKMQYGNSQYVRKDPLGWIPDEVINTYAGAEYMMGVNPTHIASDTPPLGRYLIGVSIALFNNEHVVTVVFASLSLVLMYLLGLQIFNNRYVAIIPPLLFSFEPIFYNQLIYSPLLDIIQLAFLLSSLLLFNVALYNKRSVFYFLICSVFIGFFISTKFYITGLTIIGAFVFLLLLRNRRKLIEYSLTIPMTGFILLLTYTRSFFSNPQILPFLGIQKWIFLYHKSQLILPFTIWPLLLLNKWYVWYGDQPIISDSQWRLSWPIITSLAIITMIYHFREKKSNLYAESIIIWTFFYLIFHSLGQVSARYLVIVIPCMYIISTYGILFLIRSNLFKRVLKKYLL